MFSLYYSYNYKTQIYTLIRVIIPKYTYNYMSNFTFINIMRYE